MSKKGQKVLASATILSLVMSTVAMAAPAAGTAISGSSRVDTAVAIAKQAYSKWTDSKVAVIANGADSHLVDALTVAPLAYQKKAPIFYTMGTSTIEDSVISALKAQGVTTVYVVGGAVTTAVDAQLKAAGVATVTHLAGATRFETAKAINAEFEKSGAPAGYAVVNTNASVADALSIAAEAAKQNIEIVLASDANTADVPAGAKTVYAVGGSGVLSDALVTKLNATRFGGDSRFATNAAVLKGLDANLDYTTTYVADGTNDHLVDSLPGSILAAQTGSPLVLVGSSVDSSVLDVVKTKTSKITTVTPLGGAVSTSAVATVVDPTKVDTTTPTGALAVSSVNATAADTIVVKFNQAPADSSKVVFTVQRETTPITVTTTWNGSEATLKGSANFPTGNYTVAVKNDTTDLGSSKLTIDQEKVAKIEVSTDQFAVAENGKKGYFTYRVLDQYGNDVTDSNLASITWTVPGVASGNVNDSIGTKGVITADVTDPGFNFLTLSSISVTGVDTSDNIVVTKTLKVSASVGTLSDVKLLKVTNSDNKVLQAGDDSYVWHIDYQAKDLSGNVTSNFTLLKGGLQSIKGDVSPTNPNGDDKDTITLNTSGYVNAKVINQDGKGVIELRLNNSDELTTDIPVTVTAITKNGNVSTLNLTLKKKSQVDKFTLMAPTEDVSYDESVEVPFTAFDQDGNQVTKFDDIVSNTADKTTGKFLTTKYSNITLSPVYDGQEGFYWLKRGDDTAKLMYHAPKSLGSTTDKSTVLTASTKTGKFSQITINVRKASEASTLSVSDSSFMTRLTSGAYIRLKHSYFTAKDQYGKAMSLTDYGDPTVTDWSQRTPNAGDVYVKATILSDPNGVISIAGNSSTASATNVAIADRNNHVFITGNYGVDAKTSQPIQKSGTATLKFSLMQGTKEVASKTVDFKLYKDDDIEGIKIDPAASTTTLYNINKVADKDKNVDYGNKNYVKSYAIYGTDSNGNSIVLPKDQSFTTGASNVYLSRFTQKPEVNSYTKAADFNKIELGANYDVDPGTTIVTVATKIKDSIKSASATIKMTKDAPVVKTVNIPDEVDVKDFETGNSIDDVVTIQDQYGIDLLDRLDGSVQVYLNGTLLDAAESEIPLNGQFYLTDADASAKTNIHDALTTGDRITFVVNDGKSYTMTVK